MQTLNLNLGAKTYPIYIGQNLLTKKDLITPFVKSNQIMIVTNTTIAPLYLAKTTELFKDFDIKTVIIADGEEYKTLTTLNKIYDALLENKFNRDVTIVALGGGVIGDISGFAAASYQRGVSFIQIPTTLLSQVDSSVGGKTGVNHQLAKNMIGAFYQPKCVLIDTSTLATLDDRQFSAGIAEVIKYGLLGDRIFFEFLEKNIYKLLARDNDVLSQAILKSCKDKADIVAKDELEKGSRALLNLGHTFGHAIENTLGYGKYLHGEAVAVGIVMAAHLSMLHGYIANDDVFRIKTILEKANLPISINGKIKKTDFVKAIKVDKKVKDGKIHLILLKSIGNAFISDGFDLKLFNNTISKFIK